MSPWLGNVPASGRFDFGVWSMPELDESVEERVIVLRSEPDLHRGHFHFGICKSTLCGSGVLVRVRDKINLGIAAIDRAINSYQALKFKENDREIAKETRDNQNKLDMTMPNHNPRMRRNGEGGVNEPLHEQ